MRNNWDATDDEELLRQQAEIIKLYPTLCEGGGTAPWAMRPLLKWVDSVDLIKGDDPRLGAYNWSYTAKHVAERAIKAYVANSQLILAAIMCGYLPNYIRATNCDFKRGWWYEQHLEEGV